MKRVASILAGALALAVAGSGVASAAPLKMGISAEPYPPFTYKGSGGEWTGFEVELGNAICDEMGRECTIAPVAWDGIIPSLNSGKIDFIMNSMSITKKRDKVIDFSQPYYYTYGAYIGPEDMQVEIPEGLDGMVLGVQNATTHASYARDALSDTGVELKIYNKQEQANRDLLAGRLDLVLADEIAMAEFLDRDSAADLEMKAKTPKHPAFGEGIGIGLREADEKLRDEINTAIDAVLADGTCTELSKEYFGTDICGT